jgi:hypothetical protein
MPLVREVIVIDHTLQNGVALILSEEPFAICDDQSLSDATAGLETQ